MNTKEILARIRMLEAAPAPAAPPKTKPAAPKPGQKPGEKPGTKKNPFHRPNIKPGEEPAPKACTESDNEGFFFKKQGPETDEDRARHAKYVAANKKRNAFIAKHKLNFNSTQADWNKAYDSEKDLMRENVSEMVAKLLD